MDADETREFLLTLREGLLVIARASVPAGMQPFGLALKQGCLMIVRQIERTLRLERAHV